MLSDKSQYEWLVGIIDNLNLATAVIHHKRRHGISNNQQRKQKNGKKVKVVIWSYFATLETKKNRKEIQTVSKSFIFVNQDKADQRTASHMTAIPLDHDSL